MLLLAYVCYKVTISLAIYSTSGYSKEKKRRNQGGICSLPYRNNTKVTIVRPSELYGPVPIDAITLDPVFERGLRMKPNEDDR